MLVFGMHKDVQGIIKLQDLKQLVDEVDGFMIAAHPFRGFLIFNTNEIGLTVEKAMQRPALQMVHALEVLNGKVTERENIFSGKVADGLNMPATGGSDAHDVVGVVRYTTYGARQTISMLATLCGACIASKKVSRPTKRAILVLGIYPLTSGYISCTASFGLGS